MTIPCPQPPPPPPHLVCFNVLTATHTRQHRKQQLSNSETKTADTNDIPPGCSGGKQVLLCVLVWPRRMDDFEAKNFAKYRVPFYICLNNAYIFFFGVCLPLGPVKLYILMVCAGAR